MIAIKGAVFNVLAITTVLLHESPQNTKYVPISPGELTSKVRIEDRSGINNSYKIVDSHKRTYFLKEMSPSETFQTTQTKKPTVQIAYRNPH